MKAYKIIFPIISLLLLVAAAGCAAEKDVIEINRPYIVLKAGESFDLSVKVNGEPASGKVTYTVIDQSVCSVSENGKITAISEGSTIIVIKSANGVNAFEVVVNGVPKVELQSLEVTGAPQNHTLAQGQSVKLHAQINPSDANNFYGLAWSSSDEFVLSVDEEGNVHAVNEGTATITVSAQGTNVTASVEITVTR